MGSNRITQLHVYLIGLVLMLIVGVGLYFALLKPVYADIETRSGEVKGLEGTNVDVDGKQFTWTVETGDGQVKKAKQALGTAKSRKEGKERELQILEARKQLAPPNRIDLGSGEPGQPSTDTLIRHTMTNWLNLPRVVVPLMTKFAQRLAAKHGVQVQTQFAAPATQPEPKSIPVDIIAWNLGPMTVTGGFNQVMQFARDWNSAPLLCAIDGLDCSLADRGGKVTANAGLTVYVFPTGKAVLIPQEGGSGGGGGGGGMAGVMDPALLNGTGPAPSGGGGGKPGASGMQGVQNGPG